jgi:hypothetical protein
MLRKICAGQKKVPGEIIALKITASHAILSHKHNGRASTLVRGKAERALSLIPARRAPGSELNARSCKFSSADKQLHISGDRGSFSELLG